MMRKVGINGMLQLRPPCILAAGCDGSMRPTIGHSILKFGDTGDTVHIMQIQLHILHCFMYTRI